MTVHVREKAEILFADRFSAGCKLGSRSQRSRLRLLTSGVGVDLGIEDEHVDVAPSRQDMVEPAVANIVGPAVATDQPNTLLHEVIGQALEPSRFSGRNAGQLALQRSDALTLGGDSHLARLVRV